MKILMALFVSLGLSSTSLAADGSTSGFSITAENALAKDIGAETKKLKEDYQKARQYCSKIPGFTNTCPDFKTCAETSSCSLESINVNDFVEKLKSDLDEEDEFAADDSTTSSAPKKQKTGFTQDQKDKINEFAKKIADSAPGDKQYCGYLSSKGKKIQLSAIYEEAKSEKKEAVKSEKNYKSKF
jgi:hypothetical protein